MDEAATISATNRSLPDMGRLLTHIDAVHGLYYLVMHAWFGIVPRTEFWARVPSALAVGVAAAGVVVLAGMLSTRALAVSSGVVFAVLPRVTWAAIEARPSAMTCAASVWLTVAFVAAIRGAGTPRRQAIGWAVYGVGLIGVGVLNVYVVLMVVVHAAMLPLLNARRPIVLRWLVVVVAAGGALVPHVVYVMKQAGQVDWIDPLDRRTVVFVAVTQYFDRSTAFAVLAAALGVAAGVTAARHHHHHHHHHRSAAVEAMVGRRTVGWVALAWTALPTAVLLLYSATAAKSVYVDRYLSFTAPGMALALGVAATVVARDRLRSTAVMVVLAVAALPNFVAQRGAYAKVGMDYSQVADLIGARAEPGDCLLLDDTVSWVPGPIRPLVAARPEAYGDLVDVGLGSTAVATESLWDQNLAPFMVRDRIDRCGVLWTISERDPTLPDHDSGVALPPGPRFGTVNAFFVPAELGFRLVERWQFSLAQVTRAVRP
ncbi:MULTISPECIES: hypothetical protein [unclassified Rhodococcus (in: high G+C Gram-positive bacteria)]|uniref:hypothetical protein n=1 Tax=unclassified Rhodococcus (in: high G+C Gram-positive bacteria) TaxID=192944 RepID=UPI0021C15099|nr:MULTISPECIES: hypothetical protein [unclassified Rhodococcus (in: high G+C Gram-positive bacteria)]